MINKIYSLINEIKDANDNLEIMENEILNGDRPDPWGHVLTYKCIRENRKGAK